MECLIAQFPTPSGNEFWVFLSCCAVLTGAFYSYWAYRANRRKAEESSDPQRRILPSPLETREEDPPVRRSEFNAQIARRTEQVIALEKRIDERMEKHERYVHDSFHGIRGELNTIKLEGVERGEAMVNQIDGVSNKLHGCCEQIAGISVKTARIENIETKLDKVIEREIGGGRGR
jgi:hypothetical protein